ncbi:hypothetical protein G5I_07848 [Acromyrmex echinatior]|uniref:Uncharacterized protein n=1 Tax=Acromyrmex echinatior TaxID=103372 RepID=F4WPS2_ACREC|nr:hypothetical protein G5I_07848 [Acromyrmex echinatior]
MRWCDAAFWLFAETGTANRLPQPATRKQRARDQTSSVPRGKDDAVARRSLDPYVNTRRAVPDVTFAKTWQNGNAVLVESRLPRDHPLPSETMRNRVGVTTSRRSTVYWNFSPSATTARWQNRDTAENENNDNTMTNTACYYEYTSGNVTDGSVIYWPALSLPSRKLASFQVQRYLVVGPISASLVTITNDTIGKPK